MQRCPPSRLWRSPSPGGLCLLESPTQRVYLPGSRLQLLAQAGVIGREERRALAQLGGRAGGRVSPGQVGVMRSRCRTIRTGAL